MSYRYFIPASVWVLVILILLSVPASSLPSLLLRGIRGLDKLSHFVLFAVLGWLLAYAFFKQRGNGFMVKNQHLIAIALGTFIGITTELYQHLFIATRSGEVLDVIANIFGTVFGVCILGKLWPMIEKFLAKLS